MKYVINLRSKTLSIVFLYRSLPSKKNRLTPNLFFQDLHDLLDRNISTRDFFVIGDVNLHFDNDNDPYVGKLKNALHDRNLEQVVRVPTNVKGHILD